MPTRLLGNRQRRGDELFQVTRPDPHGRHDPNIRQLAAFADGPRPYASIARRRLAVACEQLPLNL